MTCYHCDRSQCIYPRCQDVLERKTSRGADQALGQESWLVRAKVQQPREEIRTGRHFHPPGPCRFYRVQSDQCDAYAAAMGRAARAARAGNTRGLD